MRCSPFRFPFVFYRPPSRAPRFVAPIAGNFQSGRHNADVASCRRNSAESRVRQRERLVNFIIPRKLDDSWLLENRHSFGTTSKCLIFKSMLLIQYLISIALIWNYLTLSKEVVNFSFTIQDQCTYTEPWRMKANIYLSFNFETFSLLRVS